MVGWRDSGNVDASVHLYDALFYLLQSRRSEDQIFDDAPMVDSISVGRSFCGVLCFGVGR